MILGMQACVAGISILSILCSRNMVGCNGRQAGSSRVSASADQVLSWSECWGKAKVANRYRRGVHEHEDSAGRIRCENFREYR